MEDKTIDKLNLTEKILNIFKEKRKPIFLILSVVIVILLLVIFFNYYQDEKNEEISEKYIKAGIYLSSQDKKNSKLLYEEIILSKSKFYSILALNNIIENNLEEDKDKILNFFKIVEKIDFKKEKKNLIKLKKGLYLINISNDVEGKKLLNELIKDDSIWKNTAIEISTQ